MYDLLQKPNAPPAFYDFFLFLKLDCENKQKFFIWVALNL